VVDILHRAVIQGSRSRVAIRNSRVVTRSNPSKGAIPNLRLHPLRRTEEASSRRKLGTAADRLHPLLRHRFSTTHPHSLVRRVRSKCPNPLRRKLLLLRRVGSVHPHQVEASALPRQEAVMVLLLQGAALVLLRHRVGSVLLHSKLRDKLLGKLRHRVVAVEALVH